MKNFLFLLLLAVIGLSGYFFATSKKSHCFSPSFVMSAACLTINNQHLETPKKPTEKIKEVLSQTFTFLDSGNQSYAFVSEDGQYVLKLMKFYQNRNEPWKFDRLLEGFRVAETYDAENTGILYTHLKETDFLDQKIHLVDKAGRQHNLPLDPLLFAIQQKAVPTYLAITNDLNNNDTAAAKRKLEAILAMMKNEFQMGVYDADHNIWHNTGFIGEKPIRIDLGKLQYREEVKYPQLFKIEEDKIIRERIRPWIARYFPGKKIF